MRFILVIVSFFALLQGLNSSKCPPIKVEKDTIIRTKVSIRNGAKLLFRTDVESSRECYELCCDRKACNLGVMHYKHVQDFTGTVETQKTCFIFACGTPSRCIFTNHTGYAVIKMERTKPTMPPTKKLHRTIPKEEKCPAGMPVAMCSRNPCENAVCNGHDDATCVPSYCGGCSAVFYSSDGTKLQCQVKGKVRPATTQLGEGQKTKHREEDKEVKEEKPEDEKNGKDETVIKEEEVEVGPEDTSGKPPEEPFGPDDKSKEDPHRVKEWRTWLDSKKELSSSARPNVITSVYNGLETEKQERPETRKKSRGKIVVKDSPISLSLLIALSVCIAILMAVIIKLKCLGPKKKKKFAVDDGDYLINGMYL